MRALNSTLPLPETSYSNWKPPVVRTQATTGAGLPELVAAIDAFRAHGQTGLASRRRERHEFRLRELVASCFMDHVETSVLAAGELDALLDRIAGREDDPYTAAHRIVARALGRTEAS